MDGVRSWRGGPEPSFPCPSFQWHQHRRRGGKDRMGSHISPLVGWIHAGDMEDTAWRVVWDEHPQEPCRIPWPRALSPRDTENPGGISASLGQGKDRDAPGSVPQRTRILYGKLQLYRPRNMRSSIPSKIPVCFLVTCGYSCYSCK